AQHRAHAREELAWGERFDDVIVCAELEPDDAIHLGPAGRDENYRHRRLFAHRSAALVAVETGKADVEDDDVRLARAGAPERCGGGGRGGHSATLPASNTGGV